MEQIGIKMDLKNLLIYNASLLLVTLLFLSFLSFAYILVGKI